MTSVDGVRQSATALGWLTLWFQFFVYIFSFLLSGALRSPRLCLCELGLGLQIST